MPILPISDPHDSRIAEYRSVPDGVLLREMGMFVAEGRLVVRQLLGRSRLETRSLLVTEAARQSLGHMAGDDAPFPVYVAAPSIMDAVVGFNIHRGCLALGTRPPAISVAALMGGAPPATPAESARRRLLAAGAHRESSGAEPSDRRAPGSAADVADGADASGVSRVIVLEAVSNVDNVGGIFRSVAALGGHAVVVGPGCGDPLYRKAIRTSIGATLRVPFASPTAWPEALHELRASGFTLMALTPASSAEPLEDVAADLRARARVALMVGAEGDGLSAAALACADVRVRIPMAPGIDSLNVTTATAIALYRIA